MATATAPKSRAKPGAEARKNILSLISQITEEKFGEQHVGRCRDKFAELTDDEFVAIMRKAWELGADPLNGELYFRRREGQNGGSRISVMASIAAMRSYAERQGDYAGDPLPLLLIHDPAFQPKPGEEISYIQFDEARKDRFENPHGIVSCTKAVCRYVQGEFRRFSATVAWTDYVPLFQGEISAEAWLNIPVVMIGKVAEVAALRMAYPALGAIYVEEEMAKFQQQGVEVRTAQNVPSVGRAASNVRSTRGPDGLTTLGRAAATVVAGPLNDEVQKPREPIRPACLTIAVQFDKGDPIVEVREDDFFKVVGTYLQDKLDSKNPEAVLRWFDNNMKAREDFHAYDKQRGGQFFPRIREFQRIANDRMAKTTRGRRAAAKAPPPPLRERPGVH